MGDLSLKNKQHTFKIVSPVVTAIVAYTPIALGIIGFSSFFSPYSLPATTVLDGLLLVLALTQIKVWDSKLIWLLLVLGLIYSYRLIYAVTVMGAPIDEVIRSQKWLQYLIILCFFAGKKVRSSKPFLSLTKWLIPLALVKYIAVALIYKNALRPELLAENNYELSLFMGLYIVHFASLGKARYLLLIALGAEILLSGSRSGAFAFVVVLIFVTYNSRQTLGKFTFWSMMTLLSVSIPYVAFQVRGTNLDTLDRLNFLNHFLLQVQNWGFAEWLIGSPPITQLDLNTCRDLSFYTTLLSSAGDGTCYSVILHSFVLRAIFDSGLIGLFVSFFLLWVLLRRAGVTKVTSFTLIGLAIANSISVSGPNNIYVILPILIATLKLSSASSTDSTS